MTLGLLPLMNVLEIKDLMLCVKNLKKPTREFDIRKHTQFSDNSTTFKMIHNYTSCNTARNEVFNRLPRLWNAVPKIDVTQSDDYVKKQLTNFLTNHFHATFKSSNICTFHFLCPCTKCFHSPHPLNHFTGCSTDRQYMLSQQLLYFVLSHLGNYTDK